MTSFKVRGTSRYHGCLSFLEYTGYDPATGEFSFAGEVLETATPWQMQANFMHQRWGKGSDSKMAIYGGGKKPEPETPPPAPHVHTYPDTPNEVKPDGTAVWICTGCNDRWEGNPR